MKNSFKDSKAFTFCENSDIDSHSSRPTNLHDEKLDKY